MTYNNFLHEYRSQTCNISNVVSMNDEHATKLFKQCSKHGYILIGTDTEHISEMIAILKQGNYSYMPVYARFIKYEDMFHQMFDYERAIIIFNCHHGYNIHQEGNADTLKGLFELGKSLAEQFSQDFFLYQEPEKALRCMDKDGNECTIGGIWGNMDSQNFNEFTHPYWVAFRDRFASRKTVKGAPDRLWMKMFSRQMKIADAFVGCYINPAPGCYSERVTRAGTKEIFLSR